MSKSPKQKPKEKKAAMPAPKSSYTWVWPLLLALITWVIYAGSLNNELTTWDDKNYINENPSIRSVDGEAIKKMFTVGPEGYVMGNYHPLTILSYAIEYQKAYKPGPSPKIEPRIFHVTNLVFHILNTLLVYLFVMLFTKQRVTAFITALLFAVHPMHVESVAWVSERKDVMYTFFFVAAMCTYVKYLNAEKSGVKFYMFTFALFLLSLFSKAMAVTLPIVLLLIDLLTARKFTFRVIAEKIPFFALSIVFGLIAVKAQASADAIGNFVSYSFGERIILSFYGLSLYLYKALIPLNLSCYYSYPEKVGEHLPAWLYIFPFIIMGLAFLVLRTLRTRKDIFFGAAFFLVTIALVLQILPVGGTIISERYTYIPYIGLFFIFARWMNDVMEKRVLGRSVLRPVIIGSTVVVVIALCVLTIKRVEVWRDSITLWSDAIEKGSRAPAAFNGRGDAYTMKKQYDLALKDLNRAIELQPKYPEALYNRGLAYYYLGKHEEAIRDYTRAIEVKPTLAVAYFNRSGTYFTIGQFRPALEDAKKAEQLGFDVDPAYIQALEESIRKSGK